MEFTTTKGREMQNSLTYEVRADYTDETFEVLSVAADSIGEAIRIAERDPEVAKVTLVGTIDREPQAFLAW